VTLGDGDRAAFLKRFAVPSQAEAYVSRLVSDDEVLLVLAPTVPLTVETAALALAVSQTDAAGVLEIAYRRGVLERQDESGRRAYTAGNFYNRLDAFATFDDAWYDLPPEVRQALEEWSLAEYLAGVRPMVAELMSGQAQGSGPGNDSIVLLAELDALVDAARTIVVVPCDCRRLGGHCQRPLETCLQFDELADAKVARGLGRILSAREAKALLREADREGLMHTTDLAWGERRPTAICNCCTDDCFVFRGAAQLGSKGVWPRSRFLAEFHPTLCNRCGLCVRRCHFGAFAARGTATRGKPLPEVAYSPDRCWGCGLCANTCPTGAITMAPLM
jgi:ferredoxin